MRLRRALALLLTAAVVPLAGCGSGNADAKNAYVEQVQAAQRSFVNRFTLVRKRLTATSDLRQDRATLIDFGDATQRFVSALRRIKPPSAVKAQHARLIGAVKAYQLEVQQASKRLGTGTTQDRAAVRTQLSSQVQDTQEKIQKAISDINAGLRG